MRNALASISGLDPMRLAAGADDGDRCTCPWFGAHGSGRGPCKHILAARLARTNPVRLLAPTGADPETSGHYPFVS